MTRQEWLDEAADIARAFVSSQLGAWLPPHHPDWEDIRQDAQLWAIDAATKFDPQRGTKFSTYIWGSLRVWVADRNKQHRRRPEVEPVDPMIRKLPVEHERHGMSDLDAAGEPVWVADPEPQLTLEGRAFLEAIHDEDTRLMVELNLADGLSQHQTASLLGVTQSTVMRRVRKAKAVLAERGDKSLLLEAAA